MTHIQPEHYTIIPAKPDHSTGIEIILDEAFGLDRRMKSSYRLREGSTPLDGLSFAAELDGELVGSIQFWPIIIGRSTSALLLGPLAVLPVYQGVGLGMALIGKGLNAARTKGHSLVVLVGDEPYYGRAGFRPFDERSVGLPGPYDPDRVLYVELEEGAAKGISGLILPPHRI